MLTTKESKLQLFLELTTDLEPDDIRVFMDDVLHLRSLLDQKHQLETAIRGQRAKVGIHKHKIMSKPHLSDEDLDYLEHLTDLKERV